MPAYYNEIDLKAAAWLRELIKEGHIAPGDVDERSIEDVCPNDLRGYTQCHFFAGIGVWSYALRQAGWADDRPVWTGSCPCQPFSAAGKGKGFADERHLWPAFHWLIKQCRPGIVFGEQVASKDGRTWLDLVSDDMEGEGYAIGSASTVACGFGAPHKRQRIYWVADNTGCEFKRKMQEPGVKSRVGSEGVPVGRRGDSRGVADVTGQRPQGCKPPRESVDTQFEAIERDSQALNPGPVNGFWRASDWIHLRDESWRPVNPGTFPLAPRSPTHVVRLRGYGNAINVEQAQAFIESVIEINPQVLGRLNR